jgi:hypothetical protein
MVYFVKYEISSLRTVRTVYELEEVNHWVSLGHIIKIEKLKRTDGIYWKSSIFRNRKTGEYITAESRDFMFGGYKATHVTLSEEDFEEICRIKSYTRTRRTEFDWAAYILPLNPEIGEELYIEDLIEDIEVAVQTNPTLFAVNGVAKWSGTELELRRDLYNNIKYDIIG